MKGWMNIKYERMNEYWICKEEWILNMKNMNELNTEYEKMNE